MIIVHYNEPEYLNISLQTITVITNSNYELIVVE